MEDSSESSASFVVSGTTTAPAGTTVMSATSGYANFTALRLRAMPGSYTLIFSEAVGAVGVGWSWLGSVGGLLRPCS